MKNKKKKSILSKSKIQIKFDLPKEGRKESREIFKNSRRGNIAFKNKKIYSRKDKKRPSKYESL